MQYFGSDHSRLEIVEMHPKNFVQGNQLNATEKQQVRSFLGHVMVQEGQGEYRRDEGIIFSVLSKSGSL